MHASVPLILLHGASAAGYTLFDTNCSIPTQQVNYVTGPAVRSTLDILWSCLATILVCTYSVLHLGVPEQRDGQDPGRLGDLKWYFKGLSSRFGWTLTTIIAPEMYIDAAINDARQVWDCRRKLRGLMSLEEARKWTLTHLYFANMGGFAIRVHSYAGEIGAMKKANKASGALQKAQSPHAGQIAHLRGKHLLELIELGWLPNQPPVNEAEILDKAKSDPLSKGLLLFQLVYFTVNVLSRVILDLPIALLELGTISFAALSFVTMITQLGKPKSVSTPIFLKTLEIDDRMADEVAKILLNHRDYDNDKQTYCTETEARTGQLDKTSDVTTPTDAVEKQPAYVASTDLEADTTSLTSRDSASIDATARGTAKLTTASGDSEQAIRSVEPLQMKRASELFDKPLSDIFKMLNLGEFTRISNLESRASWLLFFVAACYGAIHLAAWNFKFPTTIEMWLWRGSALVVTVAIPAAMLSLVTRRYYERQREKGRHVHETVEKYLVMVLDTWTATYLCICALGRLFLIAEMFRELFYLPPEAFKSTWTVNFPAFT